jgi:uncharacterized membrane protein YdjX (TVP38/TMEM64 family)
MRSAMTRGTKLRLLAVAAGVAALLIAGRTIAFDEWFARFGAWIAGLGAAGLALYAAAHIGVTILMLPAVLMTIGAGFLFGLWTGAAVALAGATVGASLAFLIARYLARDRVARSAARDPRFAALDRAIGDKGWRIVFLLRMSAVVPFVLSNYVYGLTAIRFWPYVAASAAGLIPLTLLWVALGAAARQMDPVLVAAAPPVPRAVGIAVIAAGLLITAGVTMYVARLTRGILGRGPSE